MIAIESPTPALVDVAMRGLPAILPILDFSTIKNEVFPVIATVFSKTNSLAIKVRGLQAFVVLCGGSNDPSGGSDGLDGFGLEKKKPSSSSSALDKYTMQEKIVPLIKAIKTKEPAVMVAALNVLRVVGDVADAEFVAMDILPVLWSMSLGPLLDLKQFQAFMELIKTLSRRVEDEQIKKLQELSGAGTNGKVENEDFMAFGGITGTQFESNGNGATEYDFERLVKGRATAGGADASNPMDAGGWGSGSTTRASSPPVKPPTPAFSWSTPNPTGTAPPPAAGGFGAIKTQQASFRTVTPDLNKIEPLTPSSTQFSQPLQPTSSVISPASAAPANPWVSSASSAAAANPWASSSVSNPPTNSMAGMSLNQQRPAMSSGLSSFSLAPPPSASNTATSSFSLPQPPSAPQRSVSNSSFGQSSFGGMNSMNSMMGSATGMAASKPMNMGGMGGMSMNSMNSMNNNNNMGQMGMGMGMGMGGMAAQQPAQQQQSQKPAGGTLDKYESLL
jgi:SCY1-like protein 2